MRKQERSHKNGKRRKKGKINIRTALKKWESKYVKKWSTRRVTRVKESVSIVASVLELK